MYCNRKYSFWRQNCFRFLFLRSLQTPTAALHQQQRILSPVKRGGGAHSSPDKLRLQLPVQFDQRSSGTALFQSAACKQHCAESCAESAQAMFSLQSVAHSFSLLQRCLWYVYSTVLLLIVFALTQNVVSASARSALTPSRPSLFTAGNATSYAAGHSTAADAATDTAAGATAFICSSGHEPGVRTRGSKRDYAAMAAAADHDDDHEYEPEVSILQCPPSCHVVCTVSRSSLLTTMTRYSVNFSRL
jgi:hypothetical protein